MKQGIHRLQKLVPVMVLVFFGFAQIGCAQTNYPNNDNGAYSNNDNNGNYDNNDQALISPDQDVNYDDFQSSLSPYGNWMNYPGYGNVWVCNVAGFQPYNTGGHWAYTRFGWTWVSDYAWGWAPFHYGRWSFDNAYGWFWVPGYTWGPAWVSWRTGGDYYGWAPLGPGLSVGVNVGFGIPAASWVFLPHRYMGFRNVNNYYVNRTQNVNIIRNTTIINNTTVINNNRFVAGPQRTEVERYTGQRVQPQNIVVTNQRNNLGQDRTGAIHMYNPAVSRNGANNNINRANRLPNNTAPQDNVRQQPFNNRQQPMQNGVQQPQPNEQQRQLPMQRPQQNGTNNNNENNRVPNNGQPNFDQERQQQMEQQRQQMMNNRSEQIQQQQINQRSQQMEAQRQQMMQQRNQQMQQQRQQDVQRQQMQQQRQQQFQQQQRQQQFQQKQMNNAPNRSFSQPATPRGGNNNGRRD